MVRAALGVDRYRDNDITIRSIRPWTMGSLVAEKYFSEKGVFLVGDAAHVFPPAGGFGMNTGLQDVYSLAWRLALYVRNQSSSSPDSLSTIGRLYQQERQPVAHQNAALSVRNYRRVLGVMEACYLNHQHPEALIATLNATSAFVPLAIRQQTFQTLLKTALFPLGQLQTSPNGLFARRVTQNLRTLLDSGQGLPLLFPSHEIDFSYNDSTNEKDGVNNDKFWDRDTWATLPRLHRGMLFPHFEVQVTLESLDRFPRLLAMDDMPSKNLVTISTRDISSQLLTTDVPCAFVVMEIVTVDDVSVGNNVDLENIAKKLEETFGVSFVASRVIIVPDDYIETRVNDPKLCTMYLHESKWKKMGLSINSRTFVVIRPDGHVAAISDSNHLDRLLDDTRAILELTTYRRGLTKYY